MNIDDHEHKDKDRITFTVAVFYFLKESEASKYGKMTDDGTCVYAIFCTFLYIWTLS